MPELPWIIREAEPSELNFIYATWLNNYRYDSFLGMACKNSVFFSEYPSVIDHILSKPFTKILIACFPDTASVILSYLVYEPNTLHYLFTKEIYRHQGIARSLIERAFQGRTAVSLSHRTLMSEPVLQKYRDKFIYNPFQLFERVSLPPGGIHEQKPN